MDRANGNYDLSSTSMPTQDIVGVKITVLESTESAAIELTSSLSRRTSPLVVFTCNVDHIVLLDRDPGFAEAYASADVITADGAPIVALATLLRKRVGPRVTGADLVPELIKIADREGIKVALVGASPFSVERAGQILERKYPNLPSVLSLSPRMGFKLGDGEDLKTVRTIKESQCQIVVVCMGAPKQEKWISAHRHEFPGTLLIGAGATIDFISGVQRRAPRVMQRLGLEWAFRLLTNFGKLWRRYLVRDVAFIQIVAKRLICSSTMRKR